MSEDEHDETFFLHLNTFLHLEDRAAEEALPDLLRILRAHGSGPLEMIANMIDPAHQRGRWHWKLELRRKGSVRRRDWAPEISSLALAVEHYLLEKDLVARGEQKKNANSILATKYDTSPHAIASAVARILREYRAATGMDPPFGSDAMIGAPLSADQMEAKLKAINKEVEDYKRRHAEVESKLQRRRAEVERKRRARRAEIKSKGRARPTKS
jgi:hypothetical protein